MSEHVAIETLAEQVREDPDLTPEEKETTIRFGKPDDYAEVFTAEAGLMRRLLAHPLVTVNHVVTREHARVENVEELDAAEVQIVGVKGTVPVGALKIRASARGAGGHANMVSHSGGESA